MTIILLTTTIHIQNKLALREIDPQERIVTYTKSLSQWLEKTTFKIVVVENTGYSFPEWNEWKEKYNDRLEILYFRENELEEARYLEGNDSKGASEIFAINYAYQYSKGICNENFLIKVTGRFFIPGLEAFLQSVDINAYDGLTQNSTFRCQMVGVSISQFPVIFHPYLINKDGHYNGHVESIYEERMNLFPEEKRLRCPNFDIEPTLEGGGPIVFTII
jgi:hypothetical protein